MSMVLRSFLASLSSCQLGALSCSVLLSSCNFWNKQSNVTMVDGKVISQGQFPSVVAYYVNAAFGTSACTGVILSEKQILTAAHCVTGPRPHEFSPGRITKIFFTFERKIGGDYAKFKEARVAKIELPKSWLDLKELTEKDENFFAIDLAVIELASKIENGASARLGQDALTFGEKVTHVGAGDRGHLGGIHDAILAGQSVVIAPKEASSYVTRLEEERTRAGIAEAKVEIAKGVGQDEEAELRAGIQAGEKNLEELLKEREKLTNKFEGAKNYFFTQGGYFKRNLASLRSGDSGGPVFLKRNGEDLLVGINAVGYQGSDRLAGMSEKNFFQMATRIDRMSEGGKWLRETLGERFEP